MAAKTEYTMTINIKPFVEGLKGAVTLSERAAKEIHKLMTGQKVTANTKQFDTEMKKINTRMREVAKKGIKLDVTANTTQAQTSLRGLQERAKGTRSAFSRLRDGVANIGFAIQGATTALRTMGMIVGGIVNPFKDFEHAMSTLKAISGATTEEMEKMSDQAKELGRTTMFTASQVGELQIEFSKLGFTAEEINKVTQGTLALAAATGSSLADAASVAGNSLRGFRMEASETGRVTDVMALSFSSSALDLSKWKESMKTVAPVAATANYTIEQTASLLAKMADAGIAGSRAGMSLKKILSDLHNPGSKLNKLFKGQVKTFDELVIKLQELKEGNFDLAQASEYLDERSKPGFLTLVAGADSLADLKIKFDEAKGSAQKMADIMMADLQGSTLKFKSALEGLAIAFIEKIAPAIKGTVDVGTFLLGVIQKGLILLPILTAGVVAYGIATVATLPGVSALSIGIGIQTGMIGALISAWETLQIAMMLNPWGFIAGAIAIVATAIITLTRDSKELNTELISTRDMFKDMITMGDLDLGESKRQLDEYNKKWGTNLSTLKDVTDQYEYYQMLQTMKGTGADLTQEEAEKFRELEVLMAALNQAQINYDLENKKRKEERIQGNEADYFKELKFAAEGYYTYAIKQLELERDAREKNGWSEAQAQEAFEFKKDALDKEFTAFKAENDQEITLKEKQAKDIERIQQQLHLKTIADTWQRKEEKLQIDKEATKVRLRALIKDENELKAALLKVDQEYAVLGANLEKQKSDAATAARKKELEAQIQIASQKRQLGIATNQEVINLMREYADFIKETYGETSNQYVTALMNMKAATLQASMDHKTTYAEMMENLTGITREYQQNISSIFSLLSSQISGIYSQLYTNLNADRDADIEKLEDKAEKEKWTDQKLADEKQKILDKYAAEEKKLKIQQQRMAIVQAIVNTSSAIMKTFAQWGYPWGIAPAAAVGLLGAYNIKLIAAQKYAAGGLVPGKEQLVTVNEQGEEFIMNNRATRRLGTPLLNYINRFPERAMRLFEGLPALPSIGSIQNQYAFATGGSTDNARSELNGLKDEIRAMKDKVVTAIQAMNLNMVNRGNNQEPINIFVETTDPEARIRKDQQVLDRLISYNGVMD